MVDLEGFGEAVDFETTCTKCGDSFDCASAVGPETKSIPLPGDVSVCMTCGHFMAFDKTMKLRNLTKKEHDQIVNDPRLQHAVKAMPHFKRVTH